MHRPAPLGPGLPEPGKRTALPPLATKYGHSGVLGLGLGSGQGLVPPLARAPLPRRWRGLGGAGAPAAPSGQDRPGLGAGRGGPWAPAPE